MWARRTSSGSREHPTPKHVVQALLARMVAMAGSSSWAHFEVISEGGWFGNLLLGREPWVEIAYKDERSLQLNLGVSRQEGFLMPAMPDSWKPSGNGLWTVPVPDAES